MNKSDRPARREGRLKFHNLFSPSTYLIALFLVYALAFVENPLGWHEAIPIDARYLHIYVVFGAAFILAQAAVKPFRERAIAAPRDLSRRSEKRFFVVLGFSLACLGATALKAGGLALFAENANLFRRDFVTQLGGFVSYPIFLLTPIAAVSLLQFLRTKRGMWLLLYAVAAGLQLMQLNRQEFLICLVAPALVASFDRTVSPLKIIAYAGVAGGLIYLLGVLAIERIGGAELISKTVPVEELPFWVVLADLAGTVRLGHSVVDAVGSSGLGTYVWGVFISIFSPESSESSPHGAQAIRLLFTDAETAQSIPAPLSYYADGGLVMVAALGFVQGAIISFLWWKARVGEQFSRLVYVLNFLSLLWTIRSGTVSFSPIFLFQFAALSFVMGGQAGWRGPPRHVMRAARGLFLCTIPVCLGALLIRF